MRALLACCVVIACTSSGSKTTYDGGTDGIARHDAASDSVMTGPNGCRARDCGSDGSGGDCGTCGQTFACDDNLGLCIPNNGADVGVTFNGACWYVCPTGETDCTAGQKFQAMQFQLQAASPVESTLYFNDTCDPADGTDNLNDTGAATPTQINLEWFIHHHDAKPSSAVWWAGHHSSGCVDYTTAADCP